MAGRRRIDHSRGALSSLWCFWRLVPCGSGRPPMKLAIACEGRSAGRLSRLRGGCPGVPCAFNRVLRRNLCFGDEAYRPCCTTALRCARGISKPMSGFATATLMSSEERPLRGMRCLLDFRLSAKLHGQVGIPSQCINQIESLQLAVVATDPPSKLPSYVFRQSNRQTPPKSVTGRK